MFLESQSDILTSFVKDGINLVEEIEVIEKELSSLDSGIAASLESSKMLAGRIIPNVIQMNALRSSLDVAERDEIISRYRWGHCAFVFFTLPLIVILCVLARLS